MSVEARNAKNDQQIVWVVKAIGWFAILLLALIPVFGAALESGVGVVVLGAIALAAGLAVHVLARRASDPDGRGLDERQRSERKAAFTSIYWAMLLILTSAIVTLWIADAAGVAAASIAVSAIGAALFLPVFARALALRNDVDA